MRNRISAAKGPKNVTSKNETKTCVRAPNQKLWAF